MRISDWSSDVCSSDLCAASFQEHEQGAEHQLPMPEVPRPEYIEPAPAIPPEKLATMPCMVRRWLDRMGPFEFRHAPVAGHGPRDALHPPQRPPFPQVWFPLDEKVVVVPVSPTPHLSHR